LIIDSVQVTYIYRPRVGQSYTRGPRPITHNPYTNTRSNKVINDKTMNRKGAMDEVRNDKDIREQ
jgi:hypothetical protein